MKAITRFRKNISGNAGFSLIEVSAALVIVGISLVAVLKMFSLGSRMSAVNQDRLIAVNLLQRKLEEIRTKAFVTTLTESGSFANFINYPYDVTEVVGYSGNPFLKKVTVGINWSSSMGTSRLEIPTLVADY